MKYLLLTMCLVFTGLSYTSAQTKSINKFYRKNKFKKGVRNVALPNLLIKIGTGIAKGQMDTQEEKMAMKMVGKSIRKLKVLVAEENNPIKEKDIKKLLKDVKGKENFSDMLQVRTPDAKVNMLLRMEGDVIKNMLILVDESETFAFISLKTKISIDQINYLIHTLEEQIEYEIPLEEAIPEQEEEPLLET